MMIGSAALAAATAGAPTKWHRTPGLALTGMAMPMGVNFLTLLFGILYLTDNRPHMGPYPA